MEAYYRDELINIYCGDSLEVMKTFRAKTVDAVITDPPYSFGLASFSGIGNSKVSKWGDLLNQSYFFREVIKESKRILTDKGVIWTFCNWRMLPVLMKGCIEAGEFIESILVWDKDWIGPGGDKGLRPSYELVALICPNKIGLKNRGLRDIVKVPWSSHKPHHPAEKPIDLLRFIVQESTEQGEIVIDPFMGSGTTGVACKELNRRFIGIEIDEKYCEISAKRLSQEVLNFAG